ncbi:MAG: efflux RND transporter periplasmic adaptor subunit [Isosphaeraceae bacterium]
MFVRVPELVRRNTALSFLLVVSAATGAATLIAIILPGYWSPSSRITTSKFGYPSLYRKLGKPFPVSTTQLTRRALRYRALGEGLVRTEPYVVPIIPMGKISRVLVAEGQRVTKGQLVAEVDSTKARFKAEAAEAALETARAELERVKIGSAYVLEKERPERDRIRLEAAEKESELRRQRIQMDLDLIKKGFGSRAMVIDQQIALTALEATIREARFNLGMSSQGVTQSLVIAESAVREAELALKHRQAELADHRVYANADGLIERCLVHEGEYNQDPGKPGFLIASSWWFEANFDQGSYGRMKVGDPAKVRLEAYPDRYFRGEVAWVNPFVTYELGGPESTRPIRPMGTGAPEWPATFAVRMTLVDAEVRVVPGMTGFSTVEAKDEVDCLPRSAVSAITAGRGLVYIVEGDGFRPQEVALGVVDGDWIEVRNGLSTAERVILDGYQILEPRDRIRPTPGDGEAR